ncbi:hypothetical protein ACR77V_13005, partial [Staphylococcus epidermidis]|uniref:hypothetical protein n=1 Tax=Staphylococcus epidermidis TaxID=1282 RepID=UPI003DA45C28
MSNFRFKPFSSAKVCNYISCRKKRLKTAKNEENKKAAYFRTPPKTFSFQSLSDFPRLLLNGCKDSNYFESIFFTMKSR